MTTYRVPCANSFIAPGFLKTILETPVGLDKNATAKAKKVYMLASTLPDIPAGVLFDLVEGKRKWHIEGDNFIIE